MNLTTKLESIRRFSKAAAALGNMYVNQQDEAYNGHSCYEEGWAHGYRAAAEAMEKYVADHA